MRKVLALMVVLFQHFCAFDALALECPDLKSVTTIAAKDAQTLLKEKQAVVVELGKKDLNLDQVFSGAPSQTVILLCSGALSTCPKASEAVSAGCKKGFKTFKAVESTRGWISSG